MVFCKTYPISNIIKAAWNTDVFKSLQFERENIESPYEVKTDINQSTIKKIKNFLKNYFNNIPVLDIPEDILYGEKDVILYVENNTNIIGCVRYHYIGKFLDNDIYCNDCYCVHPLWRKKGVGDTLLMNLQIYTNKIPYSIALKEGHKINIISDSYYSSMYVYREINREINRKNKKYNQIQSLTIDKAYKLMDIFSEFNPIFIIRNRENANQYWKLYENGIHKILACIQDTYQYKNGKKMGWITAWIESPNITDEMREEASIQISESMDIFDYIWTNQKWTGQTNQWKIDGPFHWYLCRWTTSISIKRSYCILN
jgi:hypothetical protein